MTTIEVFFVKIKIFGIFQIAVFQTILSVVEAQEQAFQMLIYFDALLLIPQKNQLQQVQII